MDKETKAPMPDEFIRHISSKYEQGKVLKLDADTMQQMAFDIDVLLRHIAALTAELEIYRRNDAGGGYSKRTEKETD